MNATESIALRSDRKVLASFINSLLQQPRRIEKNISQTKFVIDQDWLCNLVKICNQRLQQNHHTMCSFECKIRYKDSHLESFQDVDSLSNFHSSRQVETVGFDISFSYLVEFAESSEPEKQDIRVTGNTDASFLRPSELHYSISFSNLSWGEDVSRHISAHIDTSIHKSKLTDIVRYFMGRSARVVSILLFFIMMMASTLYIKARSDDILKSVHANEIINNNSNDMASVNTKLNVLVKLAVSNQGGSATKLMIPMLFFTFILLLPEFLGLAIGPLLRSFILLNNYTINIFKKHEDKNTRLKWILVGAFITIPLSALFAYFKFL